MAEACARIERIVLGAIANNVYAIGDGETLVLVDPSCEAQRILAFLKGRSPDAIFVTHAHYDHIGALAELRRATGAPVYASALEEPLISGKRPIWGSYDRIEPCQVDHIVSDGELAAVGALQWRVIVTPGHSQGSTCFFLDAALADGGQSAKAPILVSGDTLFEGTIGRTDFEGGSYQAMHRSLQRLATLPDATIVLPGHGNPTTIGAERERVFARF